MLIAQPSQASIARADEYPPELMSHECRMSHLRAPAGLRSDLQSTLRETEMQQNTKIAVERLGGLAAAGRWPTGPACERTRAPGRARRPGARAPRPAPRGALDP